MPPLPPTLDEEAQSLLDAAQRRLVDLNDFQIPRLNSCAGPLAAQQELAAELREDIDAFARQIQALDLLVDEQKGERNRRELRAMVHSLQENLVKTRQNCRAALLASKRAIDSQSKSRRDELFSSSVVSEKATLNEKSTEDVLMKANEDVTASLRRTIGLMQGELERSVLTTQMLDASTATLRSTSLTHDTLTSVMGTSKQLITALEKSDWLDRIVIISAFVFFLLVVLFILKQRIIDRGIRLAFWWTRFIPDFSGDEAMLQMEKGIYTTSETLLATTTAIVTATASTVSQLISSTTISNPESTLTSALDIDTPTEGPLPTLSATLESIITDSEPPDVPEEGVLVEPEEEVERKLPSAPSVKPVDVESTRTPEQEFPAHVEL